MTDIPGCASAGSRPPASIYHAIFATLTYQAPERWLSPLLAQQPAFLQRSCDLLHFFRIVAETSGHPTMSACSLHCHMSERVTGTSTVPLQADRLLGGWWKLMTVDADAGGSPDASHLTAGSRKLAMAMVEKVPQDLPSIVCSDTPRMEIVRTVASVHWHARPTRRSERLLPAGLGSGAAEQPPFWHQLPSEECAGPQSRAPALR